MRKELLRQGYTDGVKLNTITGASVSILIGADFPKMFCVKSFRKGPQGSSVAVETPIGWSLLGPSCLRHLTLTAKLFLCARAL